MHLHEPPTHHHSPFPAEPPSHQSAETAVFLFASSLPLPGAQDASSPDTATEIQPSISDPQTGSESPAVGDVMGGSCAVDEVLEQCLSEAVGPAEDPFAADWARAQLYASTFASFL